MVLFTFPFLVFSRGHPESPVPHKCGQAMRHDDFPLTEMEPLGPGEPGEAGSVELG